MAYADELVRGGAAHVVVWQMGAEGPEACEVARCGPSGSQTSSYTIGIPDAKLNDPIKGGV